MRDAQTILTLQHYPMIQFKALCSHWALMLCPWALTYRQIDRCLFLERYFYRR